MILALSLSGQTFQLGLIEGSVRNADGSPIRGASVSATPHGVAMAMIVRRVTTDGRGSFSIDRLGYGSYDVSAEKKEDDYPPATFSFYSDKPPQIVTISSQQPAQSVTLLLGPKAAVIRGTVRDAQSGKPIPPLFEMLRTDAPLRSLSSSVRARFRILIPASTDVSVKVSSPGYQEWVYTNPDNRSPRLHMNPGEEMNLDIDLNPSPDKGKTVRFLIPDGYKGWLTLKCLQGGALTQAADENIFRFSSDGNDHTSLPHPRPPE